VLSFLALGLGFGLGADSGIGTVGSYTVFRSGTEPPSLRTLMVPLEIPAPDLQPRLDFLFGFATEEPEAPQTFYDSFSATLQSTDHSRTALFVTVDRTGTLWTPPLAGGVTLSATNVTRVAGPDPGFAPGLANRVAWLVRVFLPAPLCGTAATLFFDFFDNLDAFRSLAYVTGVQLDVGSTNPPRILDLESAASVTGPFARENGWRLDPAAKTVIVPRLPVARFFRLEADVPCAIATLVVSEDRLRLRLSCDREPSRPRVLSASQAPGPYAVENGVAVDRAEPTLSLPGVGASRFFRLRADRPVRIERIAVRGESLELTYR
jgi:hypothetical protein